jgi:hypothetical protein
MDNIQIVRLSTGEELMAEVSQEGNTINLKNVGILIPTQQNSLGIAPFMAYSEAKEGFDIQSNFIMFAVPPVQGLLDQYNEMFNPSKIITPDKKIIV